MHPNNAENEHKHRNKHQNPTEWVDTFTNNLQTHLCRWLYDIYVVIWHICVKKYLQNLFQRAQISHKFHYPQHSQKTKYSNNSKNTKKHHISSYHITNTSYHKTLHIIIKTSHHNTSYHHKKHHITNTSYHITNTSYHIIYLKEAPPLDPLPSTNIEPLPMANGINISKRLTTTIRKSNTLKASYHITSYNTHHITS